ncbi:MAG: aspartate aminotransferase family protein [Armatimonadota bacterium]|nr:aspartate aminotransferase family protein [Armatimonadota bacterium]MCX7776544.1 aspartate aminotransferase family protein [Armatimonadota bacterium]MDW8024343.1 aspartate aminotransferase family protein [Armatimonadota bacterium]
MRLEEIMRLDAEYVIRTYSRLPVAFVMGRGSRLWDTEGKEYVDFVSGIGVAAVGHCHPKIVAAVKKQVDELIHTSNLYYIAPQAELARRLWELSGGYKCFFCNSGAEANEAAIKLARRYAKLKYGEGRYEIISALGSFHGRTYAAMTATGQEKYHAGFEPLVGGFKYVPFNDIEAIQEAITERTCAIMLEPIQGESGVRIPDDDYLPKVADICDRHGILLILDEVQTGLGRTGKLWAHEHYSIKPHIFTLAKAIAGGVPMGVMLAKPDVAEAFEPACHASTFGGNFLACAAALAFLDVVAQERLVENAAAMGELLLSKLQAVTKQSRLVKEVRGKGLMLAIEFSSDVAKDMQGKLLEGGLIVNAVGGNIIRMLPPLIITEAEVEFAIRAIEGAIEELERELFECRT